MSRNRAETSAKGWSGSSYALVHAAALLGAIGVFHPFQVDFKVPHDLTAPQQWAMIAPVVSVGIFLCLHFIDERRKGRENQIWGLASRAHASGAKPGDFASSSISRLSIHSGIAVGVAVAVVKLGTLGFLTACVLGLAVMLGMVAVLCYAQSTRWSSAESEDPRHDPRLWTKRELIGRATVFDQFSWYALTTGLIWAVALINPWLSVVTGFAYGFLLYRFYYFRWDDQPAPARQGAEPSATKPDVEKVKEAIAALAAAQAVMTSELEQLISGLGEVSVKKAGTVEKSS